MEEANTASGSSSSPARRSHATSCAECRRLKLRCDRVFPCSSCIRRGCANLCPTGTLEKGKRGFLKRLEQSLPAYPKAGSPAEVEHTEVAMFVARDTAMANRIQELEAALASAGVAIPGPHTTSREGEGRAKRPRRSSPSEASSGREEPPEKYSSSSASPMPVDTADMTLGFGTLTIDVENRSRYIGPSGGAAYLNADLWKNPQTQRNPPDGRETTVHVNQSQAAVEDSSDDLIVKMACLPSHAEATRLALLFFENASFMYEVIPKGIFFRVHLPAVYRNAGGPYKPSNVHVLSLISMVLALGAFFDLSVPVSKVRSRAMEFYKLACAALNLSIPLKVDTIQAVQTLNLMTLYLLSMGGESGGDPAWQLLGMAMRSIQAQGCHRDGSRWGLPESDLEERRRVFWETHTYDRLQSFTFGRPYAQSDSHHDCEMPQSCDTPLPSDTDDSDSTFSHTRWHHHKFRFAILLGRIVDLAFSVKHPAYSMVTQLDNEINAYYTGLPAWIICDSIKHPVQELPAHAMGDAADFRRNGQIFSLANMVSLTILHLHRGPFCRALMLEPKNLANCRYATSIISLSKAAQAIINIARGLFSLYPAFTSRMWYFFFHSFTAAVCQAVLVIAAPSHPLAPAAFESMQDAVELFERADGERAESAAVRLRSLAAKASESMETYRNATARKTSTSSVQATDAASAPSSLQFPMSNMRGNPEDLLGTSTKLIRAQPGDASSPPPLAAPSPPPAPPLSVPAGRIALGPAPSSHELRDAGYTQHDVGGDRWALPPAGLDDFKGVFWNWGTETASNGQHPWGGSQPQSQQEAYLDPAQSLNVDGFDLSTFIQTGANAWMFDRAPHFESRASPTEPWFENMPPMQ